MLSKSLEDYDFKSVFSCTRVWDWEYDLFFQRSTPNHFRNAPSYNIDILEKLLSLFNLNLQIKKENIYKKKRKKRNVYYILNREIQEFLVKIKMLFLRSLKVFISSREINLCRLDTFPIMVANKSSMYNRVLAFAIRYYWAFRTTLDTTLQLQLYTSLKQTRVACYDVVRNNRRRRQKW